MDKSTLSLSYWKVNLPTCKVWPVFGLTWPFLLHRYIQCVALYTPDESVSMYSENCQ